MQDALRVGIIGVGWGSLVHAPAFGAVDGYEVVALCGRRVEPLAAASERLGISDTSTDWRAFVRRDDLDLVSITAPVQLHREMFLAALDAGKHVLCEKPLSVNADEGAEMVAAAASSDRQSAVCFENRWTPERIAIAKFVEDGGLGTPYYVQASQTAGFWHPTHALQAEWMYQLDEGGGYLKGMAAHALDFLQSLFGRVEAVCADVRTAVPHRDLPDGRSINVDADDTSALLLRLESGALGVVTTSVVGYQAASTIFGALGSNGTIEIGRVHGGGMAVTVKVGDDEPVPLVPSARQLRSGVTLPPRRSSPAVLAQAFMLEDWLGAFRGGESTAPTIHDGWRVDAVIDAARRSSGGAGWVEVPG